MWTFQDNFFLLSVHGSKKTNKKTYREEHRTRYHRHQMREHALQAASYWLQRCYLPFLKRSYTPYINTNPLDYNPLAIPCRQPRPCAKLNSSSYTEHTTDSPAPALAVAVLHRQDCAIRGKGRRFAIWLVSSEPELYIIINAW